MGPCSNTIEKEKEMSRSTMKDQKRNLMQLMKTHQLTPEWVEENERVLVAPGKTIGDCVRDAERFYCDLVLDPKSGHYIFLGGLGKRAKIRKVGEMLEQLELEEAAMVLRELLQDVETLIQKVAAVREEAQT